jgi:RNA-directed DNA polymerase
VEQGPASQNTDGLVDFKAHLLGRIAWVKRLNPHKSAKLMRLFEQINW